MKRRYGLNMQITPNHIDDSCNLLSFLFALEIRISDAFLGQMELYTPFSWHENHFTTLILFIQLPVPQLHTIKKNHYPNFYTPFNSFCYTYFNFGSNYLVVTLCSLKKKLFFLLLPKDSSYFLFSPITCLYFLILLIKYSLVRVVMIATSKVVARFTSTFLALYFY